ncbi:hypothetical protein QBC34DRAFT_382734 [Podospora aff. communis PSN243]|uniref:F-box domain-containing protein n=1 Tax=Podospora aff. communis PSN243 TaxID=3040156 RepID=A0AAV9GHY9_9PEZI|nr:hypothetical protein QBC34DRAFT_382734 [Podospora aff. communis PSN243]
MAANKITGAADTMKTNNREVIASSTTTYNSFPLLHLPAELAFGVLENLDVATVLQITRLNHLFAALVARFIQKYRAVAADDARAFRLLRTLKLAPTKITIAGLNDILSNGNCTHCEKQADMVIVAGLIRTCTTCAWESLPAEQLDLPCRKITKKDGKNLGKISVWAISLPAPGKNSAITNVKVPASQEPGWQPLHVADLDAVLADDESLFEVFEQWWLLF